ncbi:Aldehyde dehydrogenase [Entophlyctis luteolus]|nr:Aldehyde dehydrogenase [Entophlyctis luteolus]KAJ3344926.1 Aldehyde dehydrogenase [Entophlyctis luteolus]
MKVEIGDTVDPTPLDEIPKIVTALHSTFATNKTKDPQWRRTQLKKLHAFFTNQKDLIAEALYEDLHKDPATIMHDVLIVINDIVHCLDHLDEWMKPVHVKKTLFSMLDSNRILMDPLGVVCIIGTWNYPIQLLLGPAVAAIAAGNCVLLKINVVLKPSEVARRTEALLVNWIPKILDSDAVKIVTGAVPEATCLLQQKFDHIFYTGNEHVARIILAAAAKHLTPVSLELGGKCPVYVDENVPVDYVANRMMFGKLSNTGQTCIAPDYVVAHKNIVPKLIPALKKALKKMYTDDPKSTSQYGRIVSAGHTARLIDIVDRQLALPHSNVVAGGDYSKDERYVAPLIVSGVKVTDPLMENENFGPVLGIIEVDNVDEAIEIINSKGHGLCLYIHSNNSRVIKKVIMNTRSGTVSVNDYFINMVLDVPFGGVGSSGMGNYHGKAGFNSECLITRGLVASNGD